MRSLALIILSLTAHTLGADEFFATHVEPLLKERCFKCHSHEAGKMKGGLTLDSRVGWATHLNCPHLNCQTFCRNI
jgi:hypothetical protein